jgi:hypothetical protein
MTDAEAGLPGPAAEPASGAATDATATTTPPEQETTITAAPAPRRVRREGNRWFVPLVFLPLVLYAIGASIFVAWSLMRLQEEKNRPTRDYFEALPDDGDDRGVKVGDKRVSIHVPYPQEFVTREFPAGKRIHLGSTLRIGSRYKLTKSSFACLKDVGVPEAVLAKLEPLKDQELATQEEYRGRLAAHLDKGELVQFQDRLLYFARFGSLEVTPTKIERKRVSIFVTGFDRAEPCLQDSLVLHLHFKNISANEQFSPLDVYFDRWGSGSTLPLTHLQVGSYRIPGPARYAPPFSKKPPPEWIVGRKRADPDGLKPGEEGDGFVCTDGSDAAAVQALFGEDMDGKKIAAPSPGPYLWRIQMRRGIIVHDGKERSATTVIGVELTDGDLQKAGIHS